jgi:hypothetical protein
MGGCKKVNPYRKNQNGSISAFEASKLYWLLGLSRSTRLNEQVLFLISQMIS